MIGLAFDGGWRWGGWRRAVLLGYGALALLVNAGPGQAETLRLLALGDSLTAGYGLAADQGFAPQLERALRGHGLDVRVINGGVSGDTSAGGLARLDWALADKPHAAIVELGANDGLRGLEPARMQDNLDAIVARLTSGGVRVLLAGMLAPPNLGREYGDDFQAAYRQVAARHGILLYPFFLDGVAGHPKLNQKDGLHPTAEGVTVIVERIAPLVARLLRDDGGKR
jgi:acyl-CoA thioesterase-1